MPLNDDQTALLEWADTEIDRRRSQATKAQVQRAELFDWAEEELGQRRKRTSAAYKRASKILPALGKRRTALGELRKVPKEEWPDLLKAANELSRETAKANRSGYVARAGGAFGRGYVATIRNPVMEMVGAGGTDEEIEMLRQLEGIASRDFPLWSKDDPWYSRGSVQAIGMMPLAAAAMEGGALGGRAALGLGLGKVGSTAMVSAGVAAPMYPGEYKQAYSELIDAGIKPEEAKAYARPTAMLSGLLEAIVPDPIRAKNPTLTKGLKRALWDYAKQVLMRFPGELSEEGLQSFTHGGAKVVATHLDAEVPDEGLGDAFQQAVEDTKQAALPLGFMMGGGAAIGVPGVVDVAVTEGANRKRRLGELREEVRPAVQSLRSEEQTQAKWLDQQAYQQAYQSAAEKVNRGEAPSRGEVTRLGMRRQEGTDGPSRLAWFERLDKVASQTPQGAPESLPEEKAPAVVGEPEAAPTDAVDDLVTNQQAWILSMVRKFASNELQYADIKDLGQEASAALWGSREKYNPDKSQGDVKRWAGTVIHGVVATKTKEESHALPPIEEPEIEDTGPTQEQQAIAEEETTRAKEAIGGLTLKQQNVFHRHKDGESHEAIGKSHGVSHTTIGNWVREIEAEIEAAMRGKTLQEPSTAPAAEVAQEEAAVQPMRSVLQQSLGQGGAAGTPTELGMPAEMEGSGERIGARDVIEGLEKLFKIPIRYGRLRGRSLRGVYKKLWQNVRVKGEEAASVDVATHELAHGMDDKTDVLDSASDQAKAVVKLLDYEPKNQRTDEGFAEYVRGLLTGDIDVAAEVPTFHQHFLEWTQRNPEWQQIFAESKALVDRFRQAGALGRVQGQISRTGRPLPAPLKHRVVEWLHLAYQRMKEQAWYGYRFEQQLRKQGYKPQKGASFMDLYKAFTQGGPVLANTALESGVFTLGSEGEMQQIGPSLWGAMQKVPTEQYDDWVAWAYARHALESWEKGKNPGITLEDAQWVYQQGQDNQDWQDAADAVTQFNNAMLAMLVDAGVITSESAGRMIEAYKTYLPLHRVVDKHMNQGSLKSVRLINLPDPIKRRKGSGYRIVDPIQATVQRAVTFYERATSQIVTNEMIRAAEKHGANGWIEKLPPNLQRTAVKLEEVWPAVKDAMELAGLAEEDIDVLEGGDWQADVVNIFRPDFWDRSGQSVARVIRDGKPQLFYFNSDLHRTITGMGFYQLPKLLDATLGRMTRMVRMGATTLNPTFIVRNFLRDMPTYLIQRDYGGKLDPAAGVIAYAYSEFQRRIGKTENPFVRLWRQHGGQLSSVLSQDRRSVRRAVASAVSGRQKFGAMETVLDAVQVTEAGPRLAEFKGVWKKHGYSREDVARMVEEGRVPRDVLVEALNAAHEVTVDFRRVGEWGRWLNRMIPFFNARLEGVDKSIRTAKDRPSRTFARYIGYCVVPSIIYWLLHHGEDWYKERPDWMNAYWVITDEDGTPIGRIPRGHEIAQVGAGVEAILDTFKQKDPDALIRWLGEAWKQTRPGFNVAGVGTALEVYSNWDFFKDRPIINQSRQGLQSRDQAYEHNTALVKVIGDWLNISPAKLEHAIEGITGGLYRRMASPVDSWWKGDPLSPADMPVVQGFVFRTDHTRSVDEFYDEANTVSKQYRSAKLKAKRPSEELRRRYLTFDKQRDLMADLRAKNRGIKDRKTRWEHEQYIVGLARFAMGREPLDRFPNPLTVTDVPASVREIRDAHLASAASTVAKTEDLKRAQKTTKVSVEDTAAYLKTTGVSLGRLKELLKKKLRHSKYSFETIADWLSRLDRRLQNP